MNPEKLLKSMTLEEKASLCSGGDYFTTQEIERLQIPSIRFADGPNGIRLQKGEQDLLGIGESIPTVCYPATVTWASTFNRELIHRLGEALGEECAAQKINILLAPGINIKRSPLCGRNFEYFSEDPYLTGELGTEYVAGLQERGVGACLKHFAVNSQENGRMSVDAVIEERALREIYLKAFETIIKRAEPWAVMCAYNLLNGIYCSENEWLLNRVLRDEWKFDGFVVTDWSAANHRVDALRAGLDLEMPSSGGVRDKLISDAVQKEELEEAVLNKTVLRLLEKIKCCSEMNEEKTFDEGSHYRLAEQIAKEGAVLLKNEGLLPVSKDQKIVFIGEFAEYPRYQGSGSSHVNCEKVISILETVQKKMNIPYAKGFQIDKEYNDERLLTQAEELAKKAETAIVFLGLPERYESEALDRPHLSLPENQCELIRRIFAVQKKIVVVLHNGSPVEMPWIDMVSSVITMNLGGQAVGKAAFELLYGIANPSGKLAETYPMQIEDTPCYLDYHKSGKKAFYHENIFVGYRYYDAVKREVLFPFGHGLSYSKFIYSDMMLSKDEIYENEMLTVSLMVENVSEREGMEVVQLYVKNPETDIPMAQKELKGFEKIHLLPGEKKRVDFCLKSDAFHYYDTERKNWIVKSGEYEILLGQSSRNILWGKKVHIHSGSFKYFTADDTTTCCEVLKNAKETEKLRQLISKADLTNTSMGIKDKDNTEAARAARKRAEEVLNNLPLHALISFSGGNIKEEDIDNMIKEINNEKNIIFD